MKQQVWSSPKTTFEEFVPQNYIAACGDENKVYLFTCDAGGGVSGNVYEETNGLQGLQTYAGCHCGSSHLTKEGEFLGLSWSCSKWVDKADTSLGGYHACGAPHEASTESDFSNGYYVVNGAITPVIIWKGENSDNVHCTTNLDQNSWKTAKS